MHKWMFKEQKLSSKNSEPPLLPSQVSSFLSSLISVAWFLGAEVSITWEPCIRREESPEEGDIRRKELSVENSVDPDVKGVQVL